MTDGCDRSRTELRACGTSVRQGETTSNDNRVEHSMIDLSIKVDRLATELARSEDRFRTLFYETNVAFAEEDVSQAKALVDDVKASGVADFWRYMEENPSFVSSCFAAMRVTKISDALVRLMGYDIATEIAERSPESQLEDNRLMLLQLAALFDERASFSSYATLIGKGGRRIPVAVSINVVSDWTATFATLIDISDKQRAHDTLVSAQRELARANRVAAVGAFSASLAHELNQPIVAISVDAQTSRRWLEQDPPHLEQALRAIDRLQRNAERVVSVTRRTRERIKRGRLPHAPFDLGELIQETLDLIDRELLELGTQVTINCERVSVVGDRVEIQQVITNLLINAAEAMANLSLADRFASIWTGPVAEGRVGISVADNGPGIDESHWADLFEPFRTTKPDGVGLGLQICRSIVEAHGGTLEARQSTAGGAVFQFDLAVHAR
jgi:C4-dicarboxylate-specific signal transduction histidine kinase